MLASVVGSVNCIRQGHQQHKNGRPHVGARPIKSSSVRNPQDLEQEEDEDRREVSIKQHSLRAKVISETERW